MKRPALLAAACAGLLALSGCATVQQGRPPLSETVVDESALALMGASYIAASRLASAMVDLGIVTPGSPEALAIAAKLDRAKEIMTMARRAQAGGDRLTVDALAVELAAIISEITNGRN